jgi:hypothetical protein
MLVKIEEIKKTSLYPEVVERIIRGDQEAAKLQILAAEALVKSYLHKYDIPAIFGTETEEPTFTGGDVEFIKKIIKIITSYYLVRLSNPNVDIKLYRADYEDALEQLSEIQAGNLNPNLPYAETNEDTVTDVFFTCNKKKRQHI